MFKKLFFMVLSSLSLALWGQMTTIDISTGRNDDGTLMDNTGVTDNDWWCTQPDGAKVRPVTRTKYGDGASLNGNGWSDAILTANGAVNSVWLTTPSTALGDYYYESKSFTIPAGTTDAKLNLRTLSFVRSWTFLVNETTGEETQLSKTVYNSSGGPQFPGWLNSHSPEVIDYAVGPGNYHIKVQVYTNNGKLVQAMNLNGNIAYTPAANTLAVTDQATSVPFAFSIQIYPNPNSGIFKIQFPETNDGMVQVYDMGGKLVASQVFTAKQIVEINIANQPSGMYVVSISTKGGQAVTKKIIKQ